MADEAFALSPISARATLPSEADYDAIREAFMETSRGRWFLGEYAKRNRNADTGMVLDAVARIEAALAAQRQPPEPEPEPETDRLAEALVAIRQAVDRAEQEAAGVIGGLALDEHLAPIRKGSRIIKEISWRWREIGADARICDLIDSQIGAIDAGCERIAEINPRDAVRAAFDLIKHEIEALRDIENPAEPLADEAPPDAGEALEQASGQEAPVAAIAPGAHEPNEPAHAVEAAAAAEEPHEEAHHVTAEDADAHDEAVLDLVAMEMGAPDPIEAEDDMPAEAAAVVEPEPEPAPAPAEITAAAEPPSMPEPAEAEPPSLQPALPTTIELPPSPRPTHQPSLGSTLLANGILERPRAPANDPLAPIRRMSQAEKIAFFS
jgi:DNA segregation ATPase FtsK/SpoIIIE-like protein